MGRKSLSSNHPLQAWFKNLGNFTLSTRGSLFFHNISLFILILPTPNSLSSLVLYSLPQATYDILVKLSYLKAEKVQTFIESSFLLVVIYFQHFYLINSYMLFKTQNKGLKSYDYFFNELPLFIFWAHFISFTRFHPVFFICIHVFSSQTLSFLRLKLQLCEVLVGGLDD